MRKKPQGFGSPTVSVANIRNIGNSHATATVTIGNRTEDVRFHLYIPESGLMYAEAVIPRNKKDIYLWINPHIDTVSPLVCQLVMKNVDVLIVGPNA